ncbi:acyl-CoA synthetase [Quisquiliibacterium transsilvanicum]|uniref:Fatty-acyl-CoA synthase n=1 Tax=Quisquiliibacterium transsilvanicum TaxID=1549638 RepID=A0A7W8HIK9_9BURK|nr:acyl-CoA synthetase [Quisquiliibacterium transsilvanicum]MBB5272747.1 fatty-acyl-CoA synthase [Quisquiliibacterium transsilvanicum]
MSDETSGGIWNYGDIFDGLARVVPPDRPALVHGDRVTTWGRLGARTNNLARALLEDGAQPDEKLALYLRNHPAYLEGSVAAFKARQVHVNVNYRYAAEEVRYILENSDATTVVFGREFSPIVRAIQPRLPGVRRWLVVDDGSAEPLPGFATVFDVLAETGSGEPLSLRRSPDDLFFIYTGGTTGMPKGVMWRQDALRRALINPALVERVPQDLADHLQIVQEAGQGPTCLPACPLMHGTGLLSGITALVNAGTVVTLPSAHFDADELWDAVHRHRVDQLIIVGDAFAKPMLRSLDEAGGRYDVSCVLSIISSGTMWSMEVKQGLLRHMPQVTLLDSFGSSEAVGFGLSAMTADGVVETAKFQLGDDVKVFAHDGREVGRGTGEVGIIGRCGAIPEGYYKDPVKTGTTFPVIGGVRYSMPGDHCTVEEDGTITLLGRGSGCINTAGEKVFPEEVEEVLKQHPDVEDALVIGVADDKWGQAVTAVVELRAGAEFDEDALRRHVRGQLAGYKSPKRVFAVDRMFRAPNGKADYKGARDYAQKALEPAG